MTERRNQEQQQGAVGAVKQVVSNRLGKLKGCAPAGCASLLGMIFLCGASLLAIGALGWLDFLK